MAWITVWLGCGYSRGGVPDFGDAERVSRGQTERARKSPIDILGLLAGLYQSRNDVYGEYCMAQAVRFYTVGVVEPHSEAKSQRQRSNLQVSFVLALLAPQR